jgi:5-methylthioadenosine/S-adenosylhomocysteine deaminase
MPADALKIVKNGYVLTCDAENRGGRYNMLIRDGRILEICDSLDLFTTLHPYATIIDASGKLIIPGFVNAHVHSESHLLKERTDKLHFDEWARDLRFQECSAHLVDPAGYDDMRSVYLAAYFASLKSGTTLVAEFGRPWKDQGFAMFLQTIQRSDLKTVVMLQNWDQVTYAQEHNAPRTLYMVSLGAEEDYTVYSFENTTRAARDLGIPLVAHIAERRDDVEVVKKNFQKNILPVLASYQALQPSTLLLHCNHLAESDVEIIKEMALTPVICARSAARKQSGFPSLRHLIASDVRMCIGTDWGNVDMMKELQFFDQLPLLIPGLRRYPAMELLRMATINGAFALGLAGETGSLEPGKRADLTFFKIEDVRLPVLSPYSSADELAEFLVRELNGNDVSDVMIDGELYVSGGQVLTMAEEDLVEGFRTTCEKLFPVAPSVKQPVAANGQQSESAPSKPRMIPFVPVGRSPATQQEGFEEGFSVIPRQAETSDERGKNTNLQPSPPRRDRQEKPRIQPELSKDVRRVFGEDEDYETR